MQIYCPQCHVGYQFDDKLLSRQSQKLKCSNCGCVFTISEGLEIAEQLQESEPVENAFDSLVSAMNEDVAADTEPQSVVEEEPVEEAVEAEAVENVPVAEEVVEQAEIVQDTVADEVVEKPEAEGVVQTEVAQKPTNEDEADGQVDLEEIFERLSEHTENLIERERKLPFYEKVWFHVKNVLGFHFKIRWFYILCFCGIYGIIALYNNRFDIVRKAPFMNVVYRSLGIKAKIPGEGLEFQNVNWEYFDDEGGRRFEIKGFVNNTTDRDVVIPVIHIEFLDKETNLLQSLNRNLSSKEIDASAKLPLEFIIQNPAPTAKYIYMTFIDKY